VWDRELGVVVIQAAQTAVHGDTTLNQIECAFSLLDLHVLSRGSFDCLYIGPASTHALLAGAPRVGRGHLCSALREPSKGGKSSPIAS
jgi:hypothetical protein